MARSRRFVPPEDILPGELLWGHVVEVLERKREEQKREREAAGFLLAELMAAPVEQRLALVESAARFWTLGFLDRLLAPGERLPLEDIERWSELALAVARRLDPETYSRSATADREAMAWCLWGDSRRRRGDLAAADRAFHTASRRLAEGELDRSEWAIYARLAAPLRFEQGELAEALGLLDRAAGLFDQWGASEAAAEALTERGWICRQAGDPVSGLGSFLTAVGRLQIGMGPAGPLTAIRARHGLALCHAELGSAAEAEEALAEARELYSEVEDAVERLSFRVTEARIAERGGDPVRAASLLESLVGQLLAEEAFYDAAIAAVDLAQIYAAERAEGVLDRLRRQVAPLVDPGALPHRARSVVLFALRMAQRQELDTTELLAEAAEFLERAREGALLRFRPPADPLGPELHWDCLDPRLRRQICAEAGLPTGVARSAATQLSPTERDLLAWTYEVVAHVRLVFAPAEASHRLPSRARSPGEAEGRAAPR